MSGKTVDGLMALVDRYRDKLMSGGYDNVLNERGEAYSAIRAYAEALAAPQEQPALPDAVVEPVGDGLGEAVLLRPLPIGTKLYAAPAALPPPELTWLFTHCRALGMECKSDSGKWEHDIALWTDGLVRQLRAALPADPKCKALAFKGLPCVAEHCKETCFRQMNDTVALPAVQPITDEQIISAAEEHASHYDGDTRECIKADVLNAFYAGVKFARAIASPAKEQPVEGGHG